jgi:hypothetical protein
MSHLKDLHISHINLANLVGNLPVKIEELGVSECLGNLLALTSRRNLTCLKKLCIYKSKELFDLEGIEYLANSLTYLFIKECPMLRDISALTYLKKLKKLFLLAAQLSGVNLAPVASLHRSLELFSFKPCGSLSSMDITAVTNLHELHTFELFQSEAWSIYELRGLKNSLNSMPSLCSLTLDLKVKLERTRRLFFSICST